MELSIEKLSFGAGAIAHAEDGKTVFVLGGVPGDTVEATLVKEEKRFAVARIASILEKGPNHVQAVCPYVGRCGGCPWGHVSRDLQLSAKEQNFADALLRTGKLATKTLQDRNVCFPLEQNKRAWGYRNKIELQIHPSPFSLGMRGLVPDEFVALDECWLLPKEQRDLPKKIKGALAYGLNASKASQTNAGRFPVERVGIRVSSRTKELEIALWGPPGPFERARIADILQDACGATSIVRCLTKDIRGKRTTAKVEVLRGRGCWQERYETASVAPFTLSFSAPSFAQANTSGAEHLIDTVLSAIKSPSLAAGASFPLGFDLYAGAGTFTIPLTTKAERIVALESSGFAVRDLKRNAKCTGISSVRIEGGDVERLLEKGAISFYNNKHEEGNKHNDKRKHEIPSFVVVDPPRAGLAHAVVKALSAAQIPLLVYVSCNPQTLARDVERFHACGWFSLAKVAPFEMFSQTFHTESVALFTSPAALA